MQNAFTQLWTGFSKAYIGLESWVGGLFSFSGKALSIESIADQIDPRFVPKAPMSGEKIDIATRLEMSSHGFKHAKLITAESHPELFEHWTFLCTRAGFTRPLQLILCESDIPNAFAISETEMGLSTGLLQHLTYREVSAVLSHELGHANNFSKQRTQHVLAAGGLGVMGAALPLIGTDVSNSTAHTRNRFLAAGLAGSIGQIAGSKAAGYATELEADLEGAVISHDPDALISALTKLDGEASKLPAWQKVMQKTFSVHPSTEERVRWLKEIKRELDSPAQPSIQPTVQIAAGQTEVERVSTNSPQAAISGS